MNKKHILIIGGMGPQASIHAHQMIISRASELGSTDNEDYPRITHISVNVKEFISNTKNEKSAKEYLLKAISEINLESITHAFIACNTAHLLFDEIHHTFPDLNLISMVEATNSTLVKYDPSTVGILATPSTLNTGLYKPLGSNDTYIQPGEASIIEIESIIRAVILGKPLLHYVAIMKEEIDKLKNKGAKKILLGCTELSLLGSYLEYSYKDCIVDPLDIIINKIL